MHYFGDLPDSYYEVLEQKWLHKRLHLTALMLISQIGQCFGPRWLR